MATGTAFLNFFAVPHAVTTAFVSGESGRATLKKTAERVCEAKGVRLGAIGARLHWCTDLPRLGDAADREAFADELQDRDVRVVLLDPWYLMAGDVNPASMFEAGGQLRHIGDAFLSRGITPIILHHARKVLPVGDAMELQDLSHSGLAEFTRQYMLINRLERYGHDGRHRLILSVGGSAGHGGQYLVDVDEGQLDEDFGGRRWEVTVTNRADVPRPTATDREAAAATKVRERMAEDDRRLLAAVADAAVLNDEPAATKTVLKAALGWQTPRLTEVIKRAQEFDRIEEHRWQQVRGNGAKMEVVGYRLATSAGQPTVSDEHPVSPTLPGVVPGSPGIGVEEAGCSPGRPLGTGPLARDRTDPRKVTGCSAGNGPPQNLPRRERGCPMTAAELYDRLTALGLAVGVVGGDLAIGGDLPAELEDAVAGMAGPLVSLIRDRDTRPAPAPTSRPLTLEAAYAATPSHEPAGPRSKLMVEVPRSVRLLAALKLMAAAGDRQAAQEAADLEAYYARCDRGEVVIPPHPGEAALTAWNEKVRQLATRRKDRPASGKGSAA